MACQQDRCGWWRWVITVAASIQFFLAVGPLFNYSILFVSLQEEFDSGSTLTGWIGSLSLALTRLTSPLTIQLERKLSSRTVVLIGVATYCAGLLMTSFVPALGYLYLTFGVLTGVSANFMMHTSMALLLDWHAERNFSRASAIALLGTTTGMLVFSPVLTACITHYGWRNALRILSGGILVVGIADGLLLNDPPTNEDYTKVQNQSQNVSHEQKHVVEDMVPMEEIHDGGIKVTDDEGQGGENDQTNVMEVDDCKVSVHESRGNTCRGMLDMMTDPEPWLWATANVLSFTGWTFFNINFASFMEGRGLYSNQIASVIVFFASGELGGKILLAVIGDRLPFMYVYLLLVSCVCGTVLLGLLTIAKTYPTIVLLAVVSGFIRSGVYGASFTASAELFHDTYGANTILALGFVPPGIGILVSAPLSGGLYDVTGGYILGLLVIAAIFVCASAVFLLIPIRRRIRSRGSPNNAQFDCNSPTV